MEPAIVLLSGGLDSATLAGMVRAQGRPWYALSVDYGQRHRVELKSARNIARDFGSIRHVVQQFDLRAFGGSALTDEIDVPKDQLHSDTIPVTYVPARNTIFLSLALAWAESAKVNDIFMGVNALDYSGYPDCRPEFIRAFEKLARLATKAGVEGRHITIHAPLIQMNKAEIIREGTRLGVDYSRTISCYDPDSDGRACGHCDSCLLRRRGFEEARMPDPTLYQSAI